MSVLVTGQLGNIENRQLNCNHKAFVPSKDYNKHFDFSKYKLSA